MSASLAKELATLRKQTTGQLRSHYAELFGETTSSGHRDWLIKRIAWRIQVNDQGDLTERARQRAAELANDGDLRLRAPTSVAEPPTAPTPRDERIPPPGNVLERDYKGERIVVTVLPNGFLYAGEEYATLSRVAKAISGSHVNGFAFFGLGGKR